VKYKDEPIQQLQKTWGILVQDVMTPNPPTIAPNASISQAADSILEKQANHLPIVNQDRTWVGIITRDRLVRALRSEFALELEISAA
jgi:CBS domain-containing protein